MFELLSAISTVTDTAEWFLKRRLASARTELGKVARKEGLYAKQLKSAKARSNYYNRVYNDILNGNRFKYSDKILNSHIDLRFQADKSVNNLLKKLDNVKLSREERRVIQLKLQKRLKRLGYVQKVRNFIQPGPLKKLRSLKDNFVDIEKAFRKAFGKYSNQIFTMITGFTFEEFLGFINVLQYFKTTLAYLDPKKITGDLLRSLGQGVNQMFSELQEITGADTLELSPTTEVTNLSSSWLSHGWYMRMVAGANVVSNGTLMVWDNNGKVYTISNCPESVWDKMKQAQGRNGHWYAPRGAGSWLQYYMKMGVVSIW